MLPSYDVPFARYEPVDETLLQSDPICGSAGCPETLPKLPAAEDWPKNYPVPNLGMDMDIAGSFNSLDVAEKIRKHKWNWVLAKPGEGPVNPAAKTLYNFDMKLDGDIITSQYNLANVEKDLGIKYGAEWNPDVVDPATLAPAAPAAAAHG